MEKLYMESKRTNTAQFKLNGDEGIRIYGVNTLAIIFLMYTGIRFGELTALKLFL